MEYDEEFFKYFTINLEKKETDLKTEESRKIKYLEETLENNRKKLKEFDRNVIMGRIRQSEMRKEVKKLKSKLNEQKEDTVKEHQNAENLKEKQGIKEQLNEKDLQLIGLKKQLMDTIDQYQKEEMNERIQKLETSLEKSPPVLNIVIQPVPEFTVESNDSTHIDSSSPALPSKKINVRSPKVFQCLVFKKNLKNLGSLYNHQFVHKGKTFSCVVCLKQFKTIGL